MNSIKNNKKNLYINHSLFLIRFYLNIAFSIENKDLFGNEFEDYEEYTIDDYLEKMGLSDKELPGKTYK